MSNRCFILFCLIVAVSNLAFSQATIVVMQTETPIGMQTYFYSGSVNPIQEEEIRKYWNDDYYITSVAHGSKGWFVSMSKGVKWSNQSYKKSSSWPDDFVHEQKGKGRFITSLAASDNQWFVVTSQNSDFTKQEICGAPWDRLKDWIVQRWNEGYYITSIACQNSMWTVVMSKTTIYTGQAYLWSKTVDEIKSKINDKWNEGYSITAFEYGGGEFFCIMSKLSLTKKVLQHWSINQSDVGKDIKEYWDKSYRIIYLGG